ncbi:MAG: hypothetical protein JXA13_15505 [Anaerolineales bacterium]|nr:hypothetical protein [Anaerolineales bacterium]
MKLFDMLSSTKRPDKNTPLRTQEEVREAILGINRPTAPFRIIDGQKDNVDLIAEWRIVDADWFELFAKAGIKSVFRIFMKFDAEKHEVRTSDREYNISWKAGIPEISFAAEYFQGQKQSIEFGTAYAYTEELTPGQVYKYRFSTHEIKKPIQEAVIGCGWTFKGVAFGKL